MQERIDAAKAKIQELAKTYTAVKAERIAYFKADPNKRWKFDEFKSEGAQVVVDKSKLAADEQKFFTDYEKIAQAYIDRMAGIYKNNNAGLAPDKQHKLPIKMTGKMIADAALKTYLKYGKDINKVVPVELALAQAQGESHFGTRTPRKGSEVSPFNVGVYDKNDAGFLDNVKDAGEGTEMYFDLMAEDYLSNKTPEQLVQNFTNEAGQRYATDKGYESLLSQIKGSVEKIATKNGLSMPNKGELADNKVDPNNPAPENNNTNPTPNNNNTNPTPNNNNTNPTPVNPPVSANVLGGTVGEGGANAEADVRKVQELLVRHGISVSVDGKCGAKTIAAIKKFQSIKLNGVADGLITPGKNTWKALLGETVKENPAPVNPTPVNPTPNNNNTTPVTPAPEAPATGLYTHPNGSKVKITYGANAVKLNAKAETLIKNVLAGCGMTAANLTSTLRTYHDQARITKTQTFVRDPSTVSLWYGQDVLDACRRSKTVEEFAQWWEARDKRIGKVSSRHLSGQAMDVVPNGDRSKFAAFVQSLVGKSGSGVRRIIKKGELKEPVDHVEFTFYCF